MDEGLGPPVVGGEGRGPIEELYRAQFPRMARLAGLLIGDFGGGEEIAQEAFARLLVRWSSVDNRAAYVTAGVVNLSRSRLRRALVVRRHPPLPAMDVPGPEDATETIAARSVLKGALRRLPRRQREVVVLRYYGGLQDAEVAEVLGISVGSVKTHLHRATAALTLELEELR